MGRSSRKKGKNRLTILLVLAIFLIGTFAYGLTLLTPAQPPGEPKSTNASSQPTAGEEIAVIDTKFGKMTIRFFPQDAPRHVDNFKKLARQGFYDGTTFHRVIPGFMIQGGDPNTKDNDRSNDGFGGPGYTVPAEFNSRSHRRGIVSMARSQDPNSAGSQFFIVVQDSTFLDRQYTVFGEVINGMEVADKIVSQQRDEHDNPLEKIEVKVTITTNR
ncbi:MAG: peptidylprolyl isomerase [Thaumarchaeota archaeon]|nr:peptidylprolyl isomerase [Nitrososphaerota archaeon]